MKPSLSVRLFVRRMRPATSLLIALSLVLIAAVLFIAPPRVRGVSTTIVISQVYGGGGNTNATLTNDFIELFNRGNTPVSLNGWSVQYASSSGTTWQVTNLTNVTLQPGQYYLIQEAQGTGGTQALPTPDVIGAIPMAQGAGKVALVNNTTTLSGSCPTGSHIIDFVGFGGANCSETNPTPAPSATTSVLRAATGCTDTDDNSMDFSAGTPNPRNTATTLNPCGGPSNAPVVPSCPTNLTVLEATAGSASLSASDSDGVVTSASITNIAPMDPGTITLTNFVAATNPGETATATLAIADNTPLGSYTVTITWSNDDSPTPQTADCMVNVLVTALTPIHDIQGAGSSSTLTGNTVTTRGIVTGIRNNGFYIQMPENEYDGDANTSEGIFVFTSSAPPAAAALGNLVLVTGNVAEFVPTQDPLSPPLTEIAAPSVSVISTGNTLPAPVTLTAADTPVNGTIEQLERFEGMRVAVNSLTVVAPTQGNISEANATASSNGVFFGVITGLARPFREPGIQADDPAPGGMIPPIPRFDANPERIRVDSDGQTGASAINVSTGAIVTNLVGPLDYSFRTYTILPDPASPPIVSGGMIPVAAPEPAANALTIASYNLQRFYDTVNDPNVSDTTLTATAFSNRLNKASLAIRNFLRTPDILGVVEVENLSTLEQLAEKINADAVTAGDPDPMYVAYLVEGNDVGGIDVGFLVKTAPVNGSTPRVFVCPTCVVQEGLNATFTNPDSSMSTLNDRPPLRLNAVVNFTNGYSFPVTVIVNHLRSLNDIESTAPGSNGYPTEGARVRAKRLAQAEFLANLVQARQTADPNERIVLIGDFNAFEFNDGFVDLMGTIKGMPTPAGQAVLTGADLVDPDLTNLIDSAPPAERYSYTFDGSAQSLDHILINEPMLAAIAGASLEHARIGADFPETARNDANSALRLSDHDPVIGYFALPECVFPTAPGDIMANTDPGVCTASVTYQLPGASATCGQVTCTPESGSPFMIGETTVNCSTQGLAGETVTTSFKVTVSDNEAPTIICPSTQFVTSSVPVVVNYPDPMTSDNCGVKSVVCTPMSGSIFQLGTTPVNCVVEDNSGNQDQCTFNVVVSGFVPQPQFTLTDPLVCTGPGSVIVGSAGVANTSSVPQTGTVTTVLPAGLLAIAGSCTANVGTCQVVDQQTIAWSGTLAPGQSLAYSYQSQAADGLATGTELCATTTAVFGGATASVQACTTIDCPATAPGILPSSTEAGEGRAGSVLIYNFYTSDPVRPSQQNTRLSLTNTDSTRDVAVHLFFIDGSTCSISDRYVCLTASQTFSFLATDIDPGTTGFLIAVATDLATGCPINFNLLIGHAQVKMTDGYAANLPAIGVAAIAGGLPFCNPSSLTSTLAFDGVSYSRLGRVLAASSLSSRIDGNRTLLVLNRIGGDLQNSVPPVGSIFGVLFDDAEVGRSFSFAAPTCQFRQELSNSFPRTNPPYETVISAGRAGWMKLWATADTALTGVILNRNPLSQSQGSAFEHGRNLHHLTLSSGASITIPIFPPTC